MDQLGVASVAINLSLQKTELILILEVSRGTWRSANPVYVDEQGPTTWGNRDDNLTAEMAKSPCLLHGCVVELQSWGRMLWAPGGWNHIFARLRYSSVWGTSVWAVDFRSLWSSWGPVQYVLEHKCCAHPVKEHRKDPSGCLVMPRLCSGSGPQERLGSN